MKSLNNLLEKIFGQNVATTIQMHHNNEISEDILTDVIYELEDDNCIVLTGDNDKRIVLDIFTIQSINIVEDNCEVVTDDFRLVMDIVA